MISTQIVTQAPNRSAISAFSAPIGGRQLRAVAHGLGRTVKHLANGCFVPYATLWEASVIVSLQQEAGEIVKCCGPGWSKGHAA